MIVMERSEPTLVPEWLKKTGTVSSGSLTLRSDEQTASDLMRSKSFVKSNGDSGGSFSFVKTTSSYFQQSSRSNGSGRLRSCSSFGRSRRAKDYDRDVYDSFVKNKSVSLDRRRRDFSDVRCSTLSSKFERNGLHHSQSMASGKCGDTWHKKVITDSSTATASNTNGLPYKGNPNGRVSKVTFERDFPSLGAEERAVASEVGRLPSPGLTSAIQCLPISSSAIINDDTVNSVLAEVPVVVGNTGTGMLSMQQVAPSSVTPVALGSPSNLNMAEAVAQGPKCVQITPQLSVETQRLEELAIKQSRQLIPVTPSMPKTLVSSSSEKQKAKVGQQQHSVSSSFAVNHSPRIIGLVKSDVSKPSNAGKLHVLKPVREKNGAIPAVKDNLSPRTVGKLVNSTHAAAVSISGSAPTCDALNGPSHESKPVLNLLEKRSSSQAQSRNDFFNSVRKKSMANSSSVADSPIRNSSSDLDDNNSVSASVSDNLAKIVVVSAPNTSRDSDGSHSVTTSNNPLTEMTHVVNGNDDDASAGQKHVKTGDKLSTSSGPISSEEEEAAFLRSLGWEENANEGGLTKEEIDAFFRDLAKYINSKPSLKIPRGVGPKFSSPFKSHILASGGIPSDAKLES